MSDLKTTPLTSAPLAVGMQEGFRTEAEARAAWETLPNKYEFALKYIVSVGVEETLAVVLVPCDPAKYQSHLVFGEVK